ncbi:embryonic stem cell-specific 5-hydroxymethylcytosine-binding protein [Octodon degus]|uniref:Abasic site processing protein HMCES n=1 Tax=Octodon degus TaxID=10160 RepID=A0A6P3FF16_OCTDE|nr:embryonic stem cell-specific 5-hydroxymethylcytosine-binding protein [Octodon degus]
MCGRTSCHLPRDMLARACTYRDRGGRQRLPEWRHPDKYHPSYNQSPQSCSPVLLSRLHLEKDADSSERIIAPMRWGLVPSWFKEDDPSKLRFSTTNCRSDTILEKQSFRVPLGKGRRCVALVLGFYHAIQCGTVSSLQVELPCLFCLQQGSGGALDSAENWERVWEHWRPLTMAGIFDCWEPPEGGELLYSYTIITVDSCKSLHDIHHRMPAILDGDEAVSRWLDFEDVPTQEALKLIHPTENITFHPVSTVVNNSRNNSPECLTPVHLMVKKELKASGSSQKMMQWLATKSPKKEDQETSLKDKSDTPQWSSQFLQKSPLPTKRGGAGLLVQWLKQEKEEAPPIKRLHNQ